MSASPRPFRIFFHRIVRIDDVDPLALIQDFERLLAALDKVSGWKATTYVFLDSRWQYLFPRLRDKSYRDDWRDRTSRLQSQLREHFAGRPIRFVMAEEMAQFVATARTVRAPASLERLLTGDSPHATYDGPKLVKSWIQIMSNGAGVPLLTFDADVLSYVTAEVTPAESAARVEQFATSLRRLLEDVTLRRADGSPRVHSGQYVTPDVAAALQSDPTRLGAAWQVAALNGSATRVMPLCHESPVAPPRLEAEAVAAFLRSFTRRELGAPSFGLPISGAGLTMTDDLAASSPPFSLGRQNILWIDDAIPAYRHAHERFARVGVAPDAVFVKPRVSQDLRELTSANVAWHLVEYLPAFLLGCAAVTWIRRGRCTVASSAFPDAAVDRAALWSTAVEHWRMLVDEWRQEVYDGTYLGTFARRGWARSVAPQGLIAAVEELPTDDPGELAELPSNANLTERLQALVDDFRLYPQFADYWGALVDELRRRPGPDDLGSP